MSTIMLFMQRQAVVNTLMNKEQDNDIYLIHQDNYQDANKQILINQAKAGLIEVSESGEYDIHYCLNLCSLIKKSNPNTKLLLMCPDNNEANIKLVMKAKTNRLIDDFVFYDVTTDYLISKLRSL